MIRLIVNADDLGCGAHRDRGILECFDRGIVTSASLLANGPSFGSAAREVRLRCLPIGVHLNLSEGETLTGPIPGLTDPAGRLPGKAASRRRFLSGSLDHPRVREELVAQIERVLGSDLSPDHLDTHQHFFLFADLAEIVLEVAAEFDIAAVRLPLPAEPETDDGSGLLGDELALYRRLAPDIEATTRASGCFCPDGLWGMTALDRLDLDRLQDLLRQIPEGTWELMVHPGYADANQPFSGTARDVEREALTAAAVGALTDALGIRLISFGECSCGS